MTYVNFVSKAEKSDHRIYQPHSKQHININIFIDSNSKHMFWILLHTINCEMHIYLCVCIYVGAFDMLLLTLHRIEFDMSCIGLWDRCFVVSTVLSDVTCGWYTTLRSVELISRVKLRKWRSIGSATTHRVTTKPSSNSSAQTNEISWVSRSILSLHTPPPLWVKIRWTR